LNVPDTERSYEVLPNIEFLTRELAAIPLK